MKIKKESLKCDNAFFLNFVLVMIPKSEILQNTKLEFDLRRGKGKLNLLKFFTKSETELDNQVQSVRIFSNDRKMAFGLVKYVTMM